MLLVSGNIFLCKNHIYNYLYVADTQIVGMSATIGNLPELATFLRAETFSKNFRPVVLKEYIKLENRVLLIDEKSEGIFCPKRAVESDVRLI